MDTNNPVFECKTIFQNGDMLTLRSSNMKLEGYKSSKVIAIYYSELIRDGGNVSFNLLNPEYFKLDDLDKALYAFNVRLIWPNPKLESDVGYSLDVLLEKE